MGWKGRVTLGVEWEMKIAREEGKEWKRAMNEKSEGNQMKKFRWDG